MFVQVQDLLIKQFAIDHESVILVDNSVRILGEYNSEIRGPARKQVALGDWTSAIFILDQVPRHT